MDIGYIEHLGVNESNMSIDISEDFCFPGGVILTKPLGEAINSFAQCLCSENSLNANIWKARVSVPARWITGTLRWDREHFELDKVPDWSIE